MNTWPAAEPLETTRARLEPLTVGHAPEMVGVLADPAAYEYIGGGAPSSAQLAERYARQVLGCSADGQQGWLNWIIRRRDSGEPIGFTQATVTRENEALVAEVAWFVSPRHQREGLATEAASKMCDWLRSQGAGLLVAWISSANQPSVGVARRLGMHVTDVMVDGEERWES
ncbi:GNAT family N-acetyltransferase [Sanguibacter sp. HDW7]|uniref:GNAT family N-acetyltransferase n=1 Tax=Sanguibacter sp. HDW7 TaxID=2714931 RepID=UPI00140A7382|nr:GNAT family N-acetyltransferase [Sanguibacter sp. HDW7]QIK83756.1 GNAT family N-acetyltransferase [Sanguibacter sp. HDW7]